VARLEPEPFVLGLARMLLLGGFVMVHVIVTSGSTITSPVDRSRYSPGAASVTGRRSGGKR
jgi:hypothetical protein